MSWISRVKRAALLTTSLGSLCAVVAAPPAAAQDPAAESAGEVVVTAQRRSEPLRTAPVAATVIGGEEWAKQANLGVQDLARVSPSVTFEQTTSTRNNAVRIRGVGTNTTSSGIEPSTSTVIDGVVLIRSGQAAAANLIDVERIEVLRGPQGTLFGKNASVGAINITTQAPSDVFTALADTLATDDSEQQVRAAISGPLLETGPVAWTGRLSGFYRHFEGNVLNTLDGDLQNGGESKGIRGKLAGAAGDLTISIIGDYAIGQSDCCARPLREVALVNPNTLAPIAGAAVFNTSLFPVVPGRENDRVRTDTRPLDDFESSIGSVELNYEVGGFTLTSVTAYQHFLIDQQLDDDQSPNAPVAGGQPFAQDITSNEEVRGFTQELRVTSPLWSRADFVAGLYLFDAEIVQDSSNKRRLLAAPSIRDSRFRSETDFLNYAAFGQVNLHATDKLNFLFGGRYTIDTTKNDYFRDDFNPAPFRGGDIAFVKKQGEEDFTYRLGVEYEWSPEVFTYATYATGYKGPGFNVASNSLATDALVRPETSENYELGAKLRLFDKRLSIDVAAFDSVFTDFAVTSFDPIANAPQFRNAAEVRTRGVEVEFTARPTDALTLTAGFANINSEIDVPLTSCFAFQTVAQGCFDQPGPPGVLQNIVAGRVPSSPEWKYNLNASYDITPEALPFNIGLRAGYAWVGEQQLSLDQDPSRVTESYGIANASVSLSTKNDRYTFEIFGRNLGDEFYVGQIGNPQSLTGSDVQFIPRDAHRYFGVRLRATY